MVSDDAVLADGRIRWLQRLHRKDAHGRWFLPLAAALLDIGFVDDAIRTLLEGLARDAGCLAGWVLLGRCYLTTGKLDEARHLFEEVATRDGENAIALRGLAEIHRRRGERAKAAEYYRALLRLMPWDLEAQKGMAQVLGSTVSGASVPAPPRGRPTMRIDRRIPVGPAAGAPPGEELAQALIPGSMPYADLPQPPRPVPPTPADPAGAPTGDPVPEPVLDGVGIRAPAGEPECAGGRPKVSRRRQSANRADRSQAGGGVGHLRPEPRPARGIFESPPADLDPPERDAPRRSRPRRPRTDKRQAPPTMHSFMRWVERVVDGESEESSR